MEHWYDISSSPFKTHILKGLSDQPPFNEEEWNVVLRYAPRVRELSLHDDDLSVKILRSLWFRTTLLLPNLRKLRWVHEQQTSVASIRWLLSPSLIHLDIRLGEEDDTSVLAFLESYHTLCPNLKTLYIDHSGRSPRMTAAISRAIPRSPNLEALDCGHIDEEGLIHVVESRALKKFSGDLTNHESDTLRRLAAYRTPNGLLFQNLRVLELRVKDLSSITTYLRSEHQPFEDVTVDFDTDPTPKVVHEFLSALCSATRCRTLQRVVLATNCLDESESSSQPVKFQVLSPLMIFNLRKLDINIKNPITLNDEEIVRLVQAWPELESFYLNPFAAWDYPPSLQLPTLRGLLLLAQCPRMRDIGLCIDARNIPSLSEDESLIRNTAITNLMVANSPIERPVTRVAHFLLEHFPSLVAVPGCPCIVGQMPYSWLWMKVDRMIKQAVGRGSLEWSEETE